MEVYLFGNVVNLYCGFSDRPLRFASVKLTLFRATDMGAISSERDSFSGL
jgi:hypothetical protein